MELGLSAGLGSQGSSLPVIFQECEASLFSDLHRRWWLLNIRGLGFALCSVCRISAINLPFVEHFSAVALSLSDLFPLFPPTNLRMVLLIYLWLRNTLPDVPLVATTCIIWFDCEQRFVYMYIMQYWGGEIGPYFLSSSLTFLRDTY